MVEKLNGTPRKPLGQLLLKSGLVTPEDLQAALELARTSGQRLGEVLVEENLVSRDGIVSALSLQLDTPVIDVNGIRPQPSALKAVPRETALNYQVLPLLVEGNGLIVATPDLRGPEVVRELERQSHLRIRQVISLHSYLVEKIEEWYQEEPVAEAPGTKSASQGAWQVPIVRAVQRILEHAVRERATDIHIQPRASGVHVRLRINGSLKDWVSLPPGVHSNLVARLKALSNLNLEEKRRPQEGQFSSKLAGREVEFRVATIRTRWGEMATVHLTDKALSHLSLAQLGMSGPVLRAYKQALESPAGLVLVSGPADAGKTTTLYASLSEMEAQRGNIMTLEDPVEVSLEHINQVETNAQSGLSLASGLRSLLRLDPDVVMVGDLRDGETADVALQAAQGHLVLASIQAEDAVAALLRLVELGADPTLVSSAVLCSVSQRLVRRLCPYCRVLEAVPPSQGTAYSQEMGESRTSFYASRGCEVCSGSGFLGRTGVFELLPMTGGIRELLLRRASASEVRARAVQEGMIPLARDGLLKARDGTTSLAEVLRHVLPIK